MKQTIEIEVPDGKKVVLENGMLKFIDDKPPMPKTWEEFCKVHPLQPNETYITGRSTFDVQSRDLIEQRKADIDKNYLPTPQAAEAHLALMQLHQLRDCYRCGWVPDYSDHNSELIWSIIKRRGVLMVGNFVYDSHFLSFQTPKLAEEFLNNFRDLIEQAGDLI